MCVSDRKEGMTEEMTEAMAEKDQTDGNVPPPTGIGITFPERGVSRLDLWGVTDLASALMAVSVLDGMTGIPGFGAAFVTDCIGRGPGVGAANEHNWFPVRELLLLAIEKCKTGYYDCGRCFDTGRVIKFDGVDNTFRPIMHKGQRFTDITNTSVVKCPTCTHEERPPGE